MRFFDYHRRHSKRRSTTDPSSAGDDLDGHVQPPSLAQFFQEASLYKQVIANPERQTFYQASQNETVQDFAELVGKDLDTKDKAVAGTFARLSAEDGLFPDNSTSSLVDSPATSDRESYELRSSPEPLQGQSETTSTTSLTPDLLSPDGDGPAHDLSPEQVVELLRNEYGDLAPEGEEKLLMEIDAALVQDVIILGVLHVTTHRAAFHASLLDEPSRPHDIIKSGPVTVHRGGLHRRRRIWLELSRDFICAFASSQEEDRIRPLKTILLSSIQEIRPEDPKSPNEVHTIFTETPSSDDKENYLEFDTVESAREWRREFQGAVYMYKRSLLATMQGIDEDTGGIRMSIPLQYIEQHKFGHYMGSLSILTLTLSAPSSPPEQDETSSTDSERPAPTVEFLSCGSGDWEKDLGHACLGGKASTDNDEAYSKNRKIIVDFGSLGFPILTESKDNTSPKSREQAICDVLGIKSSPNTWVAQASIHGASISSGYFVITPEWVGFWSKSLAFRDQRYRISLPTIQTATAIEPTGVLRNLSIATSSYYLVLDIQAQPSLRFQFRSEEARNEAVKRIKEYTNNVATTPVSPAAPTMPGAYPSPSTPSGLIACTDPASSATLPNILEALGRSPPASPNSSRRFSSILAPLSRAASYTVRHVKEMTPHVILKLPKAINIPRDSLLPISSTHFVCLTIGSRGDVQPYISLGLGLQSHGHTVTIVTHEEYKGWVESFGIKHRTAGGDPGMLMKLSVENKMFSPQFFKESIGNYRKWLDQLLIDGWEQCRDAQVLLESPYAMGGVHIAEALGIPYFRVCTMPWTKTTQFPHPFISPPVETPRFNSMSYVLFDNVFWAATSSQVNKWRAQHLHLPPTDMSHLAQSKIPIIYNFSPSVVPKPLDWNDTCIETGYWFLDNPDGSWVPPASLVSFMSSARKDHKPIVYIGFGSITVPNARAVTEKIYQAVLKSGVRAIISKGWSARMSKNVEKDPETPKECYVIDKIPHDWLFPRIDAALHHGGAGTTSASLRAGIPTLIKPWFGDQFFWASRVHKLGAGMRVPSLRVNDLANALAKATTDRIMKEKAVMVGEKIRSEDGVHKAIKFIYVYLPKAQRSPREGYNI